MDELRKTQQGKKVGNCFAIKHFFPPDQMTQLVLSLSKRFALFCVTNIVCSSCTTFYTLSQSNRNFVTLKLKTKTVRDTSVSFVINAVPNQAQMCTVFLGDLRGNT